MTKAKAVEILNELFDSYLTMEKMCLDTIIKVDSKQFTLRDKLDEITDTKIAILTAIDVLEQSSNNETEPDNWISVKDRLPENENLYIVCRTYKGYQISFEARWQGNTWLSVVEDKQLKYITHWQPLPIPPKEDDAE